MTFYFSFLHFHFLSQNMWDNSYCWLGKYTEKKKLKLVGSLLFFLRFYLFIHDREVGGKAGSTQGAQHRTRSCLGLQDHTRGRRQVLNHWATQGSLVGSLLNKLVATRMLHSSLGWLNLQVAKLPNLALVTELVSD